jgi:hypothetical protein
MDLFEKLASLKVEKAMAQIEIAAREMNEAGERLRRRVRDWDEWVNALGVTSEVDFGKAADKYAHATTRAEREDATDEILDNIAETGELLRQAADLLTDQLEDDEEERRQREGRETLEGHLRR